MAFKKHNPGCPCCDPCAAIDSFATETEITDAGTTTIRATQHPQPPYPAWLQVEIKGDSSSAIPRLFFCWDDSSPGDGLYFDFVLDSPTGTSGTLKAYLKDGTQLDDDVYINGLVSGEWHTVTLCFDPDEKPYTVIACVQPENAYPSQCVNFELPGTFGTGRKAGYGTAAGHSGSAWFRNYTLERVWYCGDASEDCDEAGAASTCCYDDEYYECNLPTRTYCHECTKCPTGTRITQTYTGSDQQTIASNLRDHWQIASGTVVASKDDWAKIGWSDQIGHNQIYILVRWTNSTLTLTLIIGVQSCYDEEKGLFWFCLSATGRQLSKSFDIEYKVYTVTAGGAPSLVAGPTTLSSALWGNSGYHAAYGDDSEALHVTEPMRQALAGTGTISGSVTTTLTGNQCQCAATIPEVPQHYTAVVAGDPVGGGSLTLRNYFPLVLGSPAETSCANCCYVNWSGTWYGLSLDYYHIFFYGVRNTCSTELHGYFYVRDDASNIHVQAHFYKELEGLVDLRDLSGESIPFLEIVMSLGDDTGSWAGATMTITAL